MGSFPATYALLTFSLCAVFFILGLRSLLSVEPVIGKLLEALFIRVASLCRFPRSLIGRDVKVLSPFSPSSLRRFLHRFKFTLAMLFLNVYTFVFTNDLTNGEIRPDILEVRGFSYLHFTQHRWFILFTSNFIHFHLPHLAINMAMLLLFSGSLELLKGSRFAAIAYLMAMNSNVPNGLFLLPALKVLYPELWNQTVHYVDVGASLGIMGSLGALARLLKPQIRWTLMSLCVIGAIVGALYIHNLFGIDHAFSGIIGFVVSGYLLRKEEAASNILTLPPVQTDVNQTGSKIA